MTDSQPSTADFIARIKTRIDRFIAQIRATMPAKYPSIRRWMMAGIVRQPRASIAGLIAGWTALWAALWFAVITAIFGALGGLGITGHFLGSSFEGAAGSVGFLAALGGAASGAFVGFIAVYSASVVYAPLRVLIALIGGFILALVITAFLIAVEPVSLKIRGYRRMSRREAEVVTPIAEEVRGRLGLSSLPPILISDTPMLNAWSHMRAIVLTKGLLDSFGRDELSGIIAHELHHWSEGDTIAARFVWACSWPVAILSNIGRGALGDKKGSFISVIARFVTWPAYVLVAWFIVPLSMSRGRELEYQADAAAVAAGYVGGLRKALEEMGAMEGGRSGWENALMRTHPPTELRLEALEVDDTEQVTPQPPAPPSTKPARPDTLPPPQEFQDDVAALLEHPTSATSQDQT